MKFYKKKCKIILSGAKWCEVSLSGEEGEFMANLIGEYNHVIDAKGRLIVPSFLREQLGEVCYVSKGLDGCLFLYPAEEWIEFMSQVKAQSVYDPNARKLQRYFLAGSTECTFDKQGRILISNVLRLFADLKKDVVLVGAGDRAEIWDRDKWEADISFDDIEDIALEVERRKMNGI